MYRRQENTTRDNLFPDTYFCHYVVSIMLFGGTVLDVGGIGRYKLFYDEKITDANLMSGIDGCNLPYADQHFDNVISINTLEHVKNQKAFIDETIRVAKKHVVLCFPFNGIMPMIEKIKKNMGHLHSVENFPTVDWLKENYPECILSFGMPWAMHLSFIAGIKRLPNIFINRHMPLERWYPCPPEEACTVFMEILK